MTDTTMPNMHDWTLLEVAHNWAEGHVTMRFGTAGALKTLVALDASDLHVPRRNSWGPSVSVDGVELKAGAQGSSHTLQIEMQSGDPITVVASSFEVR